MAEVNPAESPGAVLPAAEAGPSSVRRSAAIAQLAAAMAKAQAEMRNPPKESVNPHFKSRYADLAAVRDAVLPALAKYGLAVVQLPCEMGDAPALTTLLTHASGEWVETTMKLRPGKLDPQGVGSAQTYARRYSLQAIAGVAAEDDDDAEAAIRPAPQQQQQAKPQQQSARPAPQQTPQAGTTQANPALRARVAQDIAQVKNRDDLSRIYRDYDAAVKAGKFGAEDVDTLDALFQEAGQRFPKPAAK